MWADDDRLTDQMWIDLAPAHFKGQIIVAKDLKDRAALGVSAGK